MDVWNGILEKAKGHKTEECTVPHLGKRIWNEFIGMKQVCLSNWN